MIFPGFSCKNLLDGPINKIPRRGGQFYWRQVNSALDLGINMIFNAMFDEVDEDTAMMKVAETANDQPTQLEFLPLNADGQALPSDWYLRLAGEASKALRGEAPRSVTIPIAP